MMSFSISVHTDRTVYIIFFESIQRPTTHISTHLNPSTHHGAPPLLSAPGRTISSNTISTRGADPRVAARRSAKVAQATKGNIMQHRRLSNQLGGTPQSLHYSFNMFILSRKQKFIKDTYSSTRWP